MSILPGSVLSGTDKNTLWCGKLCKEMVFWQTETWSRTFYIETGDLKGDGTFVLHPVNGEAVTVRTIDELLAEIVKIL